MKITMIEIFIVLAVASVLSGCQTNTERDFEAGRAAREQTAPLVLVTPQGYTLRKTCVEGVSYLLLDGKSVILQQDINGKNVPCGAPNAR